MAAALSFVQLALGAALVGGGDARLFDLMNRTDGVKMVALAAMIAASAPLVPRWLRRTGAVAVPALLVAAAGYLTLSPTIALAAAPALLLLLVWVAGAARAAR